MDEAALAAYIKDMGLAMDLDDIKVCQKYFLSEQRDPTITEIKMIDTYWSDHCRHTTFQTTIDSIKFEDATLQAAYNEYLATREAIGRTKPINLMDMGTIVAKFLKKEGKLDKLDESEEINACTVKIDVDVEGKTEKLRPHLSWIWPPWLQKNSKPKASLVTWMSPMKSTLVPLSFQ